MIDYKSEAFKKFKLSNFNRYNIWKEDIKKTPILSEKEFDKYIEDEEYVDIDMFEDGTATPNILTRYENNLTKLVKLLEKELNIKHSKGGRKSKLTIEDKLKATVDYLISDKTYLELAKEFNIHESNMYDTIAWVVHVLSKHKIIHSKKSKTGRIHALVDCKKLYFLKL